MDYINQFRIGQPYYPYTGVTPYDFWFEVTSDKIYQNGIPATKYVMVNLPKNFTLLSYTAVTLTNNYPVIHPICVFFGK